MRGKSKNPKELFTIRGTDGAKGVITRADLADLAYSKLSNGMTVKEVAALIPIGLMSVAAIQANMTRNY
jgi:hypothetical protein